MPDARYYEHHCRRILARVYSEEGVELFMSSPMTGVSMRSIMQLIHTDDRGADALARVEHFVDNTDEGGW